MYQIEFVKAYIERRINVDYHLKTFIHKLKKLILSNKLFGQAPHFLCHISPQALPKTGPSLPKSTTATRLKL